MAKLKQEVVWATADIILNRAENTLSEYADRIAVSEAAIRSSEALLQRSDLGTLLPGFERSIQHSVHRH